jgi:hypothetical protein
VALVSGHVAQQLAGSLGLYDRRQVLGLDRRQRVAEIRRRVALAVARGDPVPEDLAAGVLRAVGCLDGTAGDDLAQRGEQFRRLEVGDRKR